MRGRETYFLVHPAATYWAQDFMTDKEVGEDFTVSHCEHQWPEPNQKMNSDNLEVEGEGMSSPR